MIDLHLHLDGSLEPCDIVRIAQSSGADLPTSDIGELRKLLTVGDSCKSLAEYLEKFSLPLSVLQSAESLKTAVKLLLKRLGNQGLAYAEIRFAPQLHTAQGLSQQQAVEAAASGLLEGISEYKIKAQLILCCMRGADNVIENEETLRLAFEYLGKGVCAVDLAGDEGSFKTAEFKALFDRARALCVPITIHAGEADGAQSVVDAVEMGAARIGHGIHSAESVEVMSLLRDKRVFLETCFKSNLQTKAVPYKQSFPIRKFSDFGIAVTVNTDNMTVSGTTLKDEYKSLKSAFGFTDGELLGYAENAARGAFLPDSEREELVGIIKEKFISWLKS